MHYQMTLFTPDVLGVMLMAGVDDPLTLQAIEIVQRGLEKLDQCDGPCGCSLCGNEMHCAEDVRSIATMVPVLGGDRRLCLGFAMCEACTEQSWDVLRGQLIVLVGRFSQGDVREVQVHAMGHA